jgi:hypothetical protein
MIVNLFLVTVHLVHFDHNTSNPAHFVLEISKSPRTSMMKRREEKRPVGFKETHFAWCRSPFCKPALYLFWQVENPTHSIPGDCNLEHGVKNMLDVLDPQNLKSRQSAWYLVLFRYGIISTKFPFG